MKPLNFASPVRMIRPGKYVFDPVNRKILGKDLGIETWSPCRSRAWASDQSRSPISAVLWIQPCGYTTSNNFSRKRDYLSWLWKGFSKRGSIKEGAMMKTADWK